MKKIVLGIGIMLLVFAIAVIGSALSLVASDTTPSVVTNPGATPSSIPADGVTMSRLNVTVTDDVEVDNVTVDLTDIGGEITFMPLLGGDIYSVQTVAVEGTTPRTYSLKVNATDINGKYNDTVSIRLEVTTTAWDPWVYDTRPPYGVIDKSEAIDAVQDYFDDKITKEQALDVIQIYFG